ncbi:uncharacterized protein LOC133176411 [Saccostrea echinata]|uniref:uncharacterized protein LOC133176411 n=1 Tax=Saccostrea echinata TaxID=191078 RepID=UPI002A7FC880|nr:uncharacterized protein LOC133176411 [Saccostrea echinata]
MATKVKKWTVIFLLLACGKLGYTNENSCQRYAQEKSLPVLSFCTENITESDTSLILDAYMIPEGSISSHCMCEIKILSIYNTSVLYMKQEPSLLPTANCGLKLKLTNDTQEIRDIYCDNVDTEYHLHRHSSIMLTLSNVSRSWSTGYCLILSLRFEKARMSAQCFSPGVTRVPTTSTSPVTEISTNFRDTTQWTTSINASQSTTTFSTAPTSISTQSGSTTLTATMSKEPIVSTDNPTAIPSTDPSIPSTTIEIKNGTETKETVERQNFTTTINYDNVTSETYQTTGTVDGQNFTTTEKITLLTSETYQTTEKARSSTKNLYSSTTLDQMTQSSSTDTVTMTPVKREVVQTTEFNVLYAVLPVSGVLLLGILCLVVILCKRKRRDMGARQEFNNSMQRVGVLSPYKADTHVKDKKYIYDNDKEQSQFFFYEDQPISRARADAGSREAQRQKMDGHGLARNGLNAGVKENGAHLNKRYNSQSEFRSERTNQGSPKSVVKVTINGSESFML